MCGKDTQLFVAEIEGSNLNVCQGCAKFGRVLRRIAPENKRNKHAENKAKQAEEPEVIESIIEGFGSLIKSKREKLGLTQKDMAVKISEKESLLQKCENESAEPSIPLARKLEKFLGIKLIEEVKDEKASVDKVKNSAFTIGDFVKIRKRK